MAAIAAANPPCGNVSGGRGIDGQNAAFGVLSAESACAVPVQSADIGEAVPIVQAGLPVVCETFAALASLLLTADRATFPAVVRVGLIVGVDCMEATFRRVARVVCTRIVVVAVHRGPGGTPPVLAAVTLCTGVAIGARGTVRNELAARTGGTRVSGAWVLVIAWQGPGT